MNRDVQRSSFSQAYYEATTAQIVTLPVHIQFPALAGVEISFINPSVLLLQ